MDAVDIRINLSAVVYLETESGRWIAHCLEMDVVAEGDDAEAAVLSLMELCDLQITACLEDDDVEGIFRPAPAGAWSLFARGQDIGLLEKKPLGVRRLDVRRYAETNITRASLRPSGARC